MWASAGDPAEPDWVSPARNHWRHFPIGSNSSSWTIPYAQGKTDDRKSDDTEHRL